MVLSVRATSERNEDGQVIQVSRPQSHIVTLEIHKACKVLGVAMLCVLVMHSATQIIRFLSGNDNLLGLTPLFYMYSEQNVPTWFSSALLITCSCLLAVIAVIKSRMSDAFRHAWWLLCFAFLFLSVDEAAAVHEKVGAAFGRIFPYSMPSAWIFPYIVLGGLVGFFLFRFLLSIPRNYQILFCLSGAIYIGGAVGLEILEVVHVLGGGANDPIFVLLVTIEEVMEQGGVILFIFSLLSYIREHVGEIRMRLR